MTPKPDKTQTPSLREVRALAKRKGIPLGVVESFSGKVVVVTVSIRKVRSLVAALSALPDAIPNAEAPKKGTR